MPYAKRKYGLRKRKRAQRNYRKPYYRNKARNRPSSYTVPGYTRNQGFYGRYEGASANQELKFKDSTITGSATNNVATIDSSLHVIAQGDAENERIGRKVWIRQIQVRGRIELPSVGFIGGFSRLRLLIAIDKQCNGAAVGSNTLIQDDDVDSYYEQSNSGRFKILFDQIMIIQHNLIDNDTPAVMASKARSVNFSKTCNIPVEYNGATGVLTEIQSNNIFMQAIAQPLNVSFHLHIRVRYTD